MSNDILTACGIAPPTLCRALTDLTRQVEASSREVSSLQQKVDKAHSQGLTQREETLKCREEQLKGQLHIPNCIVSKLAMICVRLYKPIMSVYTTHDGHPDRSHDA